MNPDDLIPLSCDPAYLWDDENERLFSTKVSGYDLYALAEQLPSEHNAYKGGYRVSIGGIQQYITKDFLKNLSKDKMTSIHNTFTADGSQWHGKYIIGSLNKKTGEFSTRPNPARQNTLASAQREAERLAKVDTDKKFVVLRVEGIASVADVIWE